MLRILYLLLGNKIKNRRVMEYQTCYRPTSTASVSATPSPLFQVRF